MNKHTCSDQFTRVLAEVVVQGPLGEDIAGHLRIGIRQRRSARLRRGGSARSRGSCQLHPAAGSSTVLAWSTRCSTTGLVAGPPHRGSSTSWYRASSTTAVTTAEYIHRQSERRMIHPSIRFRGWTSTLEDRSGAPGAAGQASSSGIIWWGWSRFWKFDELSLKRVWRIFLNGLVFWYLLQLSFFYECSWDLRSLIMLDLASWNILEINCLLQDSICEDPWEDSVFLLSLDELVIFEFSKTLKLRSAPVPLRSSSLLMVITTISLNPPASSKIQAWSSS